MTNKKKIILFLGAVSLVAFGNYRQFIDNNKGKTTVEGKASEKATSSAGRNSKESKASEKATSSKGGKTVEKTVPPAKNNQNKANPEDKKPVAEAKSVQQTNKPVNNAPQKLSNETGNKKADNNAIPFLYEYEKNNPENTKKIQQNEEGQLKIDRNKDVESQFKLNTPNKGKESENTSSSSGK
mgnify:CR=1 FL=1